MKNDHGRISGSHQLPLQGSPKKLGHPQGLQGRHLRGEGNPQTIGCERPAGAIEGPGPLHIVLRDQGEGLGGGVSSQLSRRPIAQPVAVGLQRLQKGGRGGLKAPALAQGGLARAAASASASVIGSASITAAWAVLVIRGSGPGHSGQGRLGLTSMNMLT